MFDACATSDDSFTELKCGGAVMTSQMTSLCVAMTSSSPKSSPAAAGAALVNQSTPRARVSRALTFDHDEPSPSPAPPRDAVSMRPSAVARRRAHHNARPLPRTSTATDDDVTPPCHVTTAMAASLISGCIDADDDERADLIGDLSQKHVLPLERNLKHADLKAISPHTVSQSD